VSLTKTELKHIQTLLSKKGRKQKKMFVAEGVRLLEEAVRFEFQPQTILYADSLLSPRGIRLVQEMTRSGVHAVDISSRELNSLTETEAPQGIIGIFVVPEHTPAELYTSRFRRVLICESVSDPGNMGTLIRSALAFGFDLVVVTGASAEPYAPKVVRASAGAVFGVPVVECDMAPLVEFLEKHNIAILAADPRGSVRVEAMQKLILRQCVALAIGSEPDGLSETLVKSASARVGIAHTSKVESLNAAVAGSILMNEIYNLSNKVRHAK
jgi:TrmH family RNA methyltransferase